MLARQPQARLWNRTNSIFQKPRAQWPGRNRRKPLRFCAPEMFCPPQGVTSVNGVRGRLPHTRSRVRRARGGRVGDYEHEVLIRSRPRRRFGLSLPYSRRSPAQRVRREEEEQGSGRSFPPLGGNGDKRTLRRRAAMGKVTRRPQAAKLPCANNTSKAARRGRRALHKKPLYHRPPHPSRLRRATFPYPLCRFATSSLPLLAFGHFPLTGGIGPLTH